VTTLTNMNPFIGMPISDTTFDVRSGERLWGEIRCGGACKDDYGRIVVESSPNGQHSVKLQRAAWDSFEAACKAVGFWIQTTGTWRSCELQESLFNSDPPASMQRYAPPPKTAHTRGLAIDVTTAYGPFKRRKIRKALLNRSWHQARPDDEPWHYSFGIKV
jgi:hypothetical protein